MSSDMLTAVLTVADVTVAAINVIVAFSLFAYTLTHNRKSDVARAFCALMAFVAIVYLVDVAIIEVHTDNSADNWLRLQWLGIALVPAAYLHFSDALLRTTGSVSRIRRGLVVGGYLLGVVCLLAVWFTDLLVSGVAHKDHIYHLGIGPLFWVFLAYYVTVTISGWVNITRARERCLTSTSRRRMSYLMLTFAAPAAGVFPYLLIPSAFTTLSTTFVTALSLVANLTVVLMTIVIGYIVAYQGVMLPDRVIKHSLIHFLLRGPLVAALVIAIMLIIPRVDFILGLPRDTVLIMAVAICLVVFQLLINMAKPALDRVIYSHDRKEMAWIQSLDQRLLTSTDLEQFVENTLIGLCDLCRADSGFVIVLEGDEPTVRVFCGTPDAGSQFLAKTNMRQLLQTLAKSRQDEFVSNEDLIPADGHWVLPLRSYSDGGQRDPLALGILGIQAVNGRAGFSDEDLEAIYGLVHRAETALEDMLLQRQIFGLLQGLDQELAEIQQWRSAVVYARNGHRRSSAGNPSDSAGFSQIVKDALTQFWGGPKLSQSPMLRMEIVQARLADNDGVPAKAIRAVLREGIERLKPEGEQDLVAAEWTVYNILDLRFLRGQRIREIVRQLAMSESDYYRKQRIAIEQVAEGLAMMETQARQAGAQEGGFEARWRNR